MIKYRISHEHDGFLIEKELISYDYIFTIYPFRTVKKYYPIDKNGFTIGVYELCLNRNKYLYTSIDDAKKQIDIWLKEKEYTYYPTV